jgi:hypothetical protein
MRPKADGDAPKDVPKDALKDAGKDAACFDGDHIILNDRY